jgi:DNA-binding XRE family transcriptional regulator
MPASVRRHNLQRLREELNLTQATLAGWIGRSAATIKAVEIGKLALSGNLAALIASVTGANKEWLLRNDLSEPMPPLERASARLAQEDEAYNISIVLLHHLFDRLFAAARRLKRTQHRKALEHLIAESLKDLRAVDQQPDAELRYFSSADTFEFFKAHPEFLDPDLASLIDLDFLIQDAYRRQDVFDSSDSEIGSDWADSKRWIMEHATGLAPEDPGPPADAKPEPRKGRSPNPKSP